MCIYIYIQAHRFMYIDSCRHQGGRGAQHHAEIESELQAQGLGFSVSAKLFGCFKRSATLPPGPPTPRALE